MTHQLQLAESRCSRCTCRDDLLTTAVVEAARAFLAQYLREERNLHPSNRTIATMETVEAIQTLRDCAAAERRSR